MTRAHKLRIAAGATAALLLSLVLGAILILRSEWFRGKVRARIVAEVEDATGGRAEIGVVRFDWRLMRAEVESFVLHGTEPAREPPLVRADAIAVGLRIVSVLKRSVDIRYLDVRHPQVHVMLYPGGRTNLPSPRTKRAGPGTLAAILDLAIGRFSLQNGSFEATGRGTKPFSIEGRELHTEFTYDRKGPVYRGTFSAEPIDLHWGELRPGPLRVGLALAVENNRIRIDSGTLATPQSQAEFSGAIDSLVDFSGAVRYNVRAALAEVARTWGWRTQLEGPVTLIGRASFRGLSDYQVSGALHVTSLLFRPDPHFLLRDYRADASFTANSHGCAVSGMQFSGLAMASLTGKDRPLERIPVNGRIESVMLREGMVEASGIRLMALDGSFAGKAAIANLERVHLEGDVAGFDVRQALRVYGADTVPWDASASGPVQLSVWLGRANTLQLTAHMAIAPAGSGAPVHGSINPTYDAAGDTLDLAHSSLELPATRAEFSGVLGRTLHVRVDSRDLNDVLPMFDITSLPVALRGGAAHFAGTVSGKLDDPHIIGHGSATNVTWAGRTFGALEGDVDLTGEGLTLRHGSLRQGGLHLQGGGSLGMHAWKVQEASPVSAEGSFHDAPAADLLPIADLRQIPLEGTVNADAAMSGTAGDPHIGAHISVQQGTFENQPFDRFTGTIQYSSATVELTNAQIAAGAIRATIRSSYRHQPSEFAKGRLSFQADSNAMPLGEFQFMGKAYPGIGGTAELHAGGVVDIAPGKPGFRLIDLNGAIRGRGLRINDAPLRDMDLTAATRNGELAARFDSEVAGSVIRGEGRWRLTEDYPGSLSVSFTGIDLERLRVWMRGARPPGGLQLDGSAEGTLSAAGPALRPEEWQGRLEVPKLMIGPGGDLAKNGQPLALHNAEPIVIGLEHGIVKVQTARMVGRATDLSLAGTIHLREKDPLDLRVNGRFDLASLQDFNNDIYGSGAIETGVTIRGPLAQPRIAGRLDIRDATFNLTEAPLGVSKANGVILFDGSRATIQSFSGDSGGGKLTISGFAGLDGEALVFRVHAAAHEVRIRYPEDFSTVANATLSLTGASDSSTLSGRVTILRTGFNPHSDFSSVLARSAEPVRTPSAATGLLANMHFDVQVDTAPDITFQTSVAQGLQAEGSLRLRGTGTNPSVLGRINITQGQIVFFGTAFAVNQGSVAFYNPVKIEPIINVDLDTKARGVDVILNISGPINKLNLTPRSDPPMPFSDIVSLLATGRSPNSDYATLMASPASPQSLQQMGASALLGQAIASPVTGRLQRFFGVTRLKIDPTLAGLTTGLEYSPQARLTVEQQVTPELTFTYITDVTSTNPLVVQVEWAVNRNWSAVALRDENGLVGLNFVYKRRFK